MAFPVIGTPTTSAEVAAVTTPHNVLLPSGISAGDLILVIFAHAANSAIQPVPTGWTQLAQDTLANGWGVLVRKADGTESGTTLVITMNIATKSASIAWNIKGAALWAPELSTATSGTSTTPNAGNLAPTRGTRDYAWITFVVQAGEEADDGTWVTATPTGFSNTITKTSGTAGAVTVNVSLAAATQNLNAASLDAAAWTLAQSLAWKAVTIAIYPSEAFPAIDKTRRRSLIRTRL